MSSFKQKKQQQKVTEEIYKQTHFSKSEVEFLLKMYSEIVRHEKGIDRTKFRDILQNQFGMTDDILMDRIFRAFDKDNDGVINMHEWICGMSVFLKGTQEEKTNFCFIVYDLNGDGFISREEMFHLLKHCLQTKSMHDEDPEEGVRDLVEMALKKLDHDRDTRISPEDFKKAVDTEPLLIEGLGPCLPSDKCKISFVAQIMQKTNLY